ncbi:hypothetical protein TYRP_014026 [Tyrophagus putrescentiae]|nr:hypothetical protein TYRP_014026 [Tyrophagus putrescentiae]
MSGIRFIESIVFHLQMYRPANSALQLVQKVCIEVNVGGEVSPQVAGHILQLVDVLKEGAQVQWGLHVEAVQNGRHEPESLMKARSGVRKTMRVCVSSRLFPPWLPSALMPWSPVTTISDDS